MLWYIIGGYLLLGILILLGFVIYDLKQWSHDEYYLLELHPELLGALLIWPFILIVYFWSSSSWEITIKNPFYKKKS